MESMGKFRDIGIIDENGIATGIKAWTLRIRAKSIMNPEVVLYFIWIKYRINK